MSCPIITMRRLQHAVEQVASQRRQFQCVQKVFDVESRGNELGWEYGHLILSQQADIDNRINGKQNDDRRDDEQQVQQQVGEKLFGCEMYGSFVKDLSFDKDELEDRQD